MKVTNSLINIRTITSHFHPRIEAWLASQQLSTPSEVRFWIFGRNKLNYWQNDPWYNLCYFKFCNPSNFCTKIGCTKELSFYHKLKYSYPYILATQCRRPLIFQIIISVRSNNLSLKYQRYIPTGCRDV